MCAIQLPPLPLDTAQAAASLFGRGHPYLSLSQALPEVWGSLHLSEQELASSPGLAESFYPLALVTLFQHWEGLTDRQMARATTTRIDLKYAMHFPLHFPGTQPAALCTFRRKLLAHAAGRTALQELAERLSCYASRRQAAGSAEQILIPICLASRLEEMFDCMSTALAEVAACNPGWLRSNMQPHWYRRYHHRSEQVALPLEAAQFETLMQAIGQDGLHLLNAIDQCAAHQLRELPGIRALRRAWHNELFMDNGALTLRQPCGRLCAR